MSTKALEKELDKILRRPRSEENRIKLELDDLIRKFGFQAVNTWHSELPDGNYLLHRLVDDNMKIVMEYILEKHRFDLEVRRTSDDCTPLQVARKRKRDEIAKVLKKFGAREIEVEDVSAWQNDEDRGKSSNLVWMDLEMTSLEDPEILECAVIITNNDLTELTRRNWVVHFTKSKLQTLGDWHKQTFGDINNGGNGLLDEVARSTTTKEQMEKELLALLRQNCTEKKCLLAGSSIHIDKSVLKTQMPIVHDFFHYRIMDVTSIQGSIRRWAPWLEESVKHKLKKSGQDNVNHRAMDDIEWSIAFMKEFRLFLKSQRMEPLKQDKDSSLRRERRRSLDASSSKNEYNGRTQEPIGDYNKTPLHTDEKRLLTRLENERNFDVTSLHLSNTHEKVYRKNPHLREVFMNKRQLTVRGKELNNEDRKLQQKDAPMSEISNKTNTYSTTEHWGRRKLLLTEIEFLTKLAKNEKNVVVYAGGAPGSYFVYLTYLFPNLTFEIYDTNEFSINSSERIRLHQEKFSTAIAKKLQSVKHLLFICNVRTFRSHDLADEDLTTDMKNQMDWHLLMKPNASLLNFRLPRKPSRMKYLDGYLIIEPWASPRSTECRLVVLDNSGSQKEYSYDEFQSSLEYFHNYKRTEYYEHDMDTVSNDGLDHCYDCSAEIFILRNYLKSIKTKISDEELNREIAKMSSDISRWSSEQNRENVLGFKRQLSLPIKSTIISSNY